VFPLPANVIRILYGPENGRVAEIVGLRSYESRPRMYGLISSGGYIARGPAPHIDKIRPVYDWRDKDVWLAIHRNGWDYNRAYDKLYRLRRNPRELRIADPFSIESHRHLRDWLIGWPDLWDRMRKRVPTVHAVALFDGRMHKPARRVGESWRDATYRYLQEAQEGDRATRKRLIERKLREHGRHATFPMHETRRCQLCRFSWHDLAKLAMFGDPERRRGIK